MDEGSECPGIIDLIDVRDVNDMNDIFVSNVMIDMIVI